MIPYKLSEKLDTIIGLLRSIDEKLDKPAIQVVNPQIDDQVEAIREQQRRAMSYARR